LSLDCRHRLLLVEQYTYEKSERILVQQGIRCRITGQSRVGHSASLGLLGVPPNRRQNV
jgi:hypothetical protein